MKSFFTLLLLCTSSLCYAAEQAEQIFHKLAPSLYQIRLIDQASGEKSSIGSGFQISADGLIATNYHVISGFANHPHKYRIEYLDQHGQKAPLKLLSVDIVNDLAIVQRAQQQAMPYFNIAKQAPTKGEELYSLGNPHDLGMIVVPGTYNGLKKESFNDRIHFTGSVNSGMSGGPVVNANAEVVGINVATSGNQMGFLVPHEKLVDLYQAYLQVPPVSIEQQMTEQLYANQQKLVATLVNSDWLLKQLGDAMVPIIDAPFIRCWGESNNDKPDDIALVVVANCALEEDTFVDANFETATVEMEFKYLKNKKLSDLKFYHIYQKHILRAGPGNKATKEDVTEYQCHHDLVHTSDETIINKSIFCTRAYKKFTALFDVLYIGASVDKDDQALVSHFTMSGVKQDSAMAFTRKFVESVTWK
jgi:serine protease Do